MLDDVLRIGVAWTSGLLAVLVIAAARARDDLDRILAVDTLAALMVGLLVLLGFLRRSPYYLDAALVLALLAFGSTLAAVRYLEGRGEE